MSEATYTPTEIQVFGLRAEGYAKRLPDGRWEVQPVADGIPQIYTDEDFQKTYGRTLTMKRAISNAMAAVAHWNEFGPANGFEEVVAQLEAELRIYRGRKL